MADLLLPDFCRHEVHDFQSAGSSLRSIETIEYEHRAADARWACFAQQVTVDITPGHSTNNFSPLHALGAGIDRDPLNSVHILYDPGHVATMHSAGWGPISYRLNTELSIQAWHWNQTGRWSDPGGRGYFVGDANSSGDIRRSFGYNLPHRGTTSNYGTNGDYSMLDDGNTATYWKTDPYLDETYTGESNTLHPKWFIVDLGRRWV